MASAIASFCSIFNTMQEKYTIQDMPIQKIIAYDNN